MTPVLVDDIAAMRALPRTGARGLVMTMGALHSGHASLMDRTRELVGPHGQVITSIFVNPTQFGPDEDYDRYPRTFEADVAVCADHGVDAVFAPAAADVYPAGASGSTVVVDPGEVGSELEGAQRPGHFGGVLTVVAKFLNMVTPDVAVFGEKDYQQLVLIRRMVRALDVPVRVVGAPIARDGDGLALSTRNTYLDADARSRAAAIPDAIGAGRRRAADGGSAPDIEHVVRARLLDAGITVDYATVVGPDLGAAPQHGQARLLVAAHVGGVRLLDNAAVRLTGAA